MSSAVALAVGSMVLGGLADFLFKRAQFRGVAPAGFLAVHSLCFNLTALVLSLSTDGLVFDAPTLGYGVVAGAALFSAFYLFLRSLRRGDATVYVPIYRLSFVLTAVLAVLMLGERLTLLRVVAIGLAALGVLALADLGRLRRLGLLDKSFGLLLAATGLYGVGVVLYRAAMLGGSRPGPFLMTQAGVFLTCALVLATTTEGRRPNRATLQHAPFTGILICSSLFLLLAALRVGDASVAVPISQLSFVLTSLLAVAFLGERLSRGRLVGTAAAVLAVITFNLPGASS